MADRVDSMTDAELRTKLAEHGFPIMPITASTRGLLVKKLKLVLDNKSKSRISDSKIETAKKYARYSSGEDSDLDTNNVTRDRRGRRATTGGAMLPPTTSKTRRPTPKKETPAKHDARKDTDSDEEKSPVRTHEEVETVTTRRVIRTFANKDQEDYETGSDSDVDVDRRTAVPHRSNSKSSDYISSTLPASEATSIPVRPSIYSRPSVAASTGYSSTATTSSSDHLNSIRSRLGLTSSLGDRPSVSSYTPSFSTTHQPSTSSAVDEIESPYLSNFTRRLVTLKADPPRQTSYLDRDANNESSTFIPRRSYISSIPRSDVNDYKTSNDYKFLKNNLVSLALVALVALFFFCLFFMYIVRKNDITSAVDNQSNGITYCQLNIPSNSPGVNCVPKEQISFAKDLLKVLHPILMAKASAYQCGTPGATPYLTNREILEIACAKSKTVEASQCRTDLNNLQLMIIKNPLLGLNVVKLNNLYSNDPDYTPVLSMEDVIELRAKGNLGIAITDPSTPFTCLVRNTMYSAGSTLLIVTALTLLAIGTQRAYKYYINYKRRKSEEIYSMVEQIIDVISQETEDSGEPYISVDHVRDTLISPQNRDKMTSVWDAAVKFIQRNESRVRMEVQSVDGEDCRVWRWISAHSSPKRSATWQGQAFETQEGSVNNLTVSPTPCLKIRHMFEKNDIGNTNLKSVVQDAILEKCGEFCNILHIDVDRTSCCVYVKCATQADAGVVYRSLHGWWYEGRLITVKYLRLERYMQRFPNSPTVGPYLKSSHQRRNWEE